MAYLIAHRYWAQRRKTGIKDVLIKNPAKKKRQLRLFQWMRGRQAEEEEEVEEREEEDEEAPCKYQGIECNKVKIRWGESASRREEGTN